MGLWLNWKEWGKKTQTAIWNLNETKSISLCCHFIFHHFDSDGTGGLQGAFCFTHRVLSSGNRREGALDRQEKSVPPPSVSLPMPKPKEERRGLSLETEKEIQRQEASEGPLTRLNGNSDQNWAGKEKPPPPQQAPLHVLKYKQSWPRGIVEIAIINSDGAPGGASFSIIVAGLVSHSSNRISKVQVLPPGAPLETHYFKAPQ